ncbi:MAG TPA: hypothetical protein VFW94_24320 [Candidatus Acidoferrales bacterium]|nr:hypothetical protein [Candidatus Acidoferrales bacterium]
MSYTIMVRCESGHSQYIEVENLLGIEWARETAAVLDGTSSLFLRAPIGDDSMVGRCGICGKQIACRVKESEEAITGGK